MSQRFQLVTGAGRDIGRAVAETLSRSGIRTLLHYASSREGAEATLAAIRASGGDGQLVQGDFTDSEDLRRFIDEVRSLLGDGTLETLVHNAAFTEATPMEEDVLEVAGRTFKTNVVAPAVITHALADRMTEGSSIITLSVAATDRVFAPEFGVFAASKAALDVLVRHWAAALGPRGIRVNGVAPGVVDVNFRAELLKDPAFRSRLEGDTALGGAAQVRDITDVVAFLASNEARWITGQVVEASGGWRL